MPAMTLTCTFRAMLLAGALAVAGVANAADAPAISPAPPPGTTPAAALDACEQAALAEMQSRNPEAVDVQALEDQMAVTETPGGQTEVEGGGQLALKVGEWLPFTYDCAYSPTTGEVTSLQIR